MSIKANIEFLEAYLCDLEKCYRIARKICLSDFMTPEKFLSLVPTKAQQEGWLVKKAERLVKDSKKTKSSTSTDRLAKYAEILSDPNVRSKHAKRLVVRKKRIAETFIKNLSKPKEKAKRAAQLANDTGFDGGIFFNIFDNPISSESISNLDEQIKVIPQIIAAIEKPADNSIIPDGAELLTVPQVARILGWSESVVRQRKRKQIELLPLPIKVGGVFQWSRRELIRWLEHGCPPRQKWEQIKQGKDL